MFCMNSLIISEVLVDTFIQTLAKQCYYTNYKLFLYIPCLPCGYRLLRILTLQLHWDDSLAEPDVEETVHSVKGKNGWQSKVGGVLHEITITTNYHIII